MSLTISQRAAAIAPSPTLAISNKAKEMAATGLDVISFGAGEPDFNTPDFICDAAVEAMQKGMTKYTPASGTMEIRNAVCMKLLRDNGLSYEPQDIIVSNGAKQCLFTALQAIIDPGDEVIIPTPCWVSYPEMVQMAGGKPVFIKTRQEDRFIPTAEDVKSAITEKTKAMIITSPGNPCGSVIDRADLQVYGDLAVEHGFYIISDEIYEKLLYDGLEHLSIAQLSDAIKSQTILINGLSKAYAMTGWRIGYAAGPRNVIKAMGNYQSQASSNPNSIAQHAAAVALSGDQTCVAEMNKAFEDRRNRAVERISRMKGVSCAKPRGAFYIMLNVSGLYGKKMPDGRVVRDSDDFAAYLLEKELVAVVPGSAFMADAFIRLSYAFDPVRCAEGLDRIEHFINSLQ